jgi:hypothetical protein
MSINIKDYLRGNPKFLSQFISNIIGEEIESKIGGVDFLQQTRKENLVPDGIFMQKSLMFF